MGEIEAEPNILEVGLLIYNFADDPKTVTDVLGIEPSKVFYKGEKINSKMPIKHHYNGWWLQSNVDVNAVNFGKHTAALLSVIEPRLSNFDKLPDGCEVELACRLIWNDADERPGFHFSAQLLQVLVRIKASVNFSLF